jgi:hypothetical protein
MFNNTAEVTMRREIVVRGGGFVLVEEREAEVQTKVLVPGRLYRFDDEPALLRVRLDSTRAGNNAWWQANDLPQGALNDAPYCPLLRALVAEFLWLPPASRDNRARVWAENTHDAIQLLAQKEGWVVQGGSATINFAARVVATAPDSIRDLLREITQQVDWSDPLVQRQGALEVRVVYHAPQGAAEMLPEAGSGYRTLYNHFFFPLRRWVWRVVDGTAYALLVPSGGEAYVVSPDHEAEWLRLVGELFVARHPLPRNDGAID